MSSVEQSQPQKMVLPPHLQHLQHLQGEELKKAIHNEYVSQAMSFILRQTEYDEETAFKRLCELKDPVKVVSEYLGVKPRPESPTKSKNQMKYGEIRKFMDFGARQYNIQNERRKQLQQQLEQQQLEQQQLEQQQQEQQQQEQEQQQEQQQPEQEQQQEQQQQEQEQQQEQQQQEQEQITE
jgi:TATA-binding protein-associated factor Taf7